MSVWISTHGSAGLILGEDSSSFTKTSQISSGAFRSIAHNQARCYVLYPLPSPPQHTTHLSAVAVDFMADSAYVDCFELMSGNHSLHKEDKLETGQRFNIPLPSGVKPAEGKGLALCLQLVFRSVNGMISVQSAAVEAVVRAPRGPKILKSDSGTWKTDDVRPWNQPQTHTQARVVFDTDFTTVPSVTVGITGLDAGNEANVRVKAYASNVDKLGFTVHADSWGDTTLYSCTISWVALGV
ncbi:unnamed protein product [Clonostachys rhizophaga]|uniref:H-type lectin domain-containing protein n=1 Tax=Clonostachys rhizophaga TaxID=160324 RepID=A0A9N9YQN9_9HYPO|nr:unnamed protein product [Clonostachys rhizophaga]